jgi:hypothetical protein
MLSLADFVQSGVDHHLKYGKQNIVENLSILNNLTTFYSHMSSVQHPITLELHTFKKSAALSQPYLNKASLSTKIKLH